MKNKAFCAAALCVLFVSGCATGGSRGRIGSFKSLSVPLASDSEDESFADAVRRDPFPRAQARDVQVAVRP